MKKVSESLVHGQIFCVVVALLNVMWRVLQLIWELGDWYCWYVLQYLWWSVVLLVVTIGMLKVAIFADSCIEEEAKPAILPALCCMGFMISFMKDFEYVVLLGLWDGLEFRTIVLGFTMVTYYMLALVSASGYVEKAEKAETK